MDRLHLFKGFTMMIIIVHVTSQHFPASQHPFEHFSLLDDDNSNRDWNFFNPFQRPKQKLVKATGSVLTPAEITFDTYKALLPQMINRLRANNIYWPLTQQQHQQQQQQKNQQQQQQQQQQHYANRLSYQQPILLRPRSYRSIGSFTQFQQRYPTNKQININRLKFNDMLQPRMEVATMIDDDAKMYQNTKEPLTLNASQLKQFLLWWNIAYSNGRNSLKINTNNYNTRYPQQSDEPEDVLLQKWPTIQKRIPSKMHFAFVGQDGQLNYDDNDNDNSFLEEVNYPLALPLFMPMSLEQMPSDDTFLKRNAFRNHKRQKTKPQQERFIPSISAGAMTNLGNFFKDLKSNVQFMENQRLSPGEEKLLDGDHPISMLHDELIHAGEGSPTDGTAAFLHAIRTYRPSQKIRSLVSLNPEGYHGSQFLDPNYMWVGLGK